MSWPAMPRPARRFGLSAWLGGLVIVLLPAAVLAVTGLELQDAWRQPALLAAAGVIALLGLWLVRIETARRVLLSKSCLALYALAVCWLWYCALDPGSGLTHLANGILLTVPMLLLGVQELLATMSAPPRRAHLLLHRLSQRQEWPTKVSEVRSLPEVVALRRTLQDDPTPALMLLMHPKPEVRLAVLASLAFRPRWKKSQALLVVQVAKYATEPTVRVAAVTALAHVTDPSVLGHLASYLRDPVAEVRRATSEALFTDIRDRWPAVRHSVRAALSDLRCGGDGALSCPGALPTMVLADLTVWAGEIGVVGKRSTLTLIRYYRRAVQEDPSPQLLAHLSEQMISGGVPAAVRVEMAHMVRDAGGLEPRLLGRMLDSDQPAPLRLIAAEAVLQQEPDDPNATEVLREVARQPNRELAIAAAVVVQKCLLVDMGLPIGQPAPPPQSKQGAEVTRRVMQWANQKAPTAAPPAGPPQQTRRIDASTGSALHGLTETPLPQPTPSHRMVPPTDPPAAPEASAAAEPIDKKPDNKTPWIW